MTLVTHFTSPESFFFYKMGIRNPGLPTYLLGLFEAQVSLGMFKCLANWKALLGDTSYCYWLDDYWWVKMRDAFDSIKLSFREDHRMFLHEEEFIALGLLVLSVINSRRGREPWSLVDGQQHRYLVAVIAGSGIIPQSALSSPYFFSQKFGARWRLVTSSLMC